MSTYTVKIGSYEGGDTGYNPTPISIDGKELTPNDRTDIPIINMGNSTLYPCRKRVVDEVPTGTLIYVMNCSMLRDGIYKVVPPDTGTSLSDSSICTSCTPTQGTSHDDSFDPGINVRR